MSSDDDEKRSERAGLEWECRDCPRCSGHGLCLVFHPRHQGSRHGRREDMTSFVAEIGAHCSCRVGCWIRGKTEPRLQARIPWVTDILAGRSRWLLEPPGGDEVEGARQEMEVAS